MNIDTKIYETLSNAELNIQLKQLENKYVKIQSEIKNKITELSYIDNEYVAIKDILNNRKKYF